VDGIVGVGVPGASPAETMRQQLTDVFVYRLLKPAALRHGGHLSEAELEASLPGIEQDRVARLKTILGPFPVPLARLDWASWHAWTDFDNYRYEFYLPSRPDPLSGTIYGRPVAVAGSLTWMRDNLAERRDLATVLRRFHRRQVWMYGQYDLRADNSRRKACGTAPAARCRVVTVPGGGHGLIDSQLVDTDRVVDDIVHNLIAVLGPVR
jgi:pimeloyl-ACP methyl ester carboxylesterase